VLWRSSAGERGHGPLKRGPCLEESRYGLGSKRISTAAGRGCGKVGLGIHWVKIQKPVIIFLNFGTASTEYVACRWQMCRFVGPS
jgi:hypothetical protein